MPTSGGVAAIRPAAATGPCCRTRPAGSRTGPPRRGPSHPVTCDRGHPVLIPSETVRRVLCDCELATVVVRPSLLDETGRCANPLADLLLEASREVLYVGRAERVVPPRLRRALEVRDQHCRFPGCRAHVRRCHAHHVREWENGGSTDLDNRVLLWCVITAPSTKATGPSPAPPTPHQAQPARGRSPHHHDRLGPDVPRTQGAPLLTPRCTTSRAFQRRVTSRTSPLQDLSIAWSALRVGEEEGDGVRHQCVREREAVVDALDRPQLDRGAVRAASER